MHLPTRATVPLTCTQVSALHRTRLSRLAAAFLLMAVGAQMACHRPLFPPDEPRTQYDRYDRLRGELPPTRVTDKYGRPRENVRERLLRKAGAQ